MKKLLQRSASIILFFYITLLAPALTHAAALDNWHWRNPLPPSNLLTGVAYGKETYVAVGELGTVISSVNGTAWVKSNTGINNSLHKVAFGDNRFVAVGEDIGTYDVILTSTDGVHWEKYSRALYRLNNVSYGAGCFVTVGVFGIMLSSCDGPSWKWYKPLTEATLADSAFGNDTFVIVGENGLILQSDSLAGRGNAMPWLQLLILDR